MCFYHYLFVFLYLSFKLSMCVYTYISMCILSPQTCSVFVSVLHSSFIVCTIMTSIYPCIYLSLIYGQALKDCIWPDEVHDPLSNPLYNDPEVPHEFVGAGPNQARAMPWRFPGVMSATRALESWLQSAAQQDIYSCLWSFARHSGGYETLWGKVRPRGPCSNES